MRAKLFPFAQPNELVSYLGWRYSSFREKFFDWRYSIDTSGSESSYLDAKKSESAKHAVPYEAVQHTVFHRLIRAVRTHAGRLDRYTFIDLGSGKARALLYAADYPFKGFIGVEFGENLHEIASENIIRFRAIMKDKRQFCLHCMDVLDYRFPDDNLVVFLYNPFTGPVMDAVAERLDQLARGGSGDLFIAYRNPTCLDAFNAHCFDVLEVNSSFAVIRGNHVLS